MALIFRDQRNGLFVVCSLVMLGIHLEHVQQARVSGQIFLVSWLVVIHLQFLASSHNRRCNAVDLPEPGLPTINPTLVT